MSKLYRSLLWSGLVVAGVAACGDDVTVAPPPNAGVQSVTVGPTGVTIAVGQTLQMAAAVNADAGVATTVTWTSSNPATASVNPASGLVTGVAGGSVAITACSTVATGVCGQATVTVATSAPVTVSIKSITNTVIGTGEVPVNINAVAGQINVTLNLDSGSQQVSNVQVLIDGQVACQQGFSAIQEAAAKAQAALIAGGDATAALVVEIVCSINTAAFNATTGVPTYLNGPRALTARVNLVGSAPVATPSFPLVFANANVVVITTSVANGSSANSATGILWQTGDLTATGLPVIYTAANPTIQQVVLTPAGLNPKTLTTAPFTATWAKGTTVGNGGSAAFELGGLTVAANSTVNGAVGPAGVSAALNFDNKGPGAPTFAANPNGRRNGWINPTVGLTGQNGATVFPGVISATDNDWILNGAADGGVGGYNRLLRIGDGLAGTVAAARAATASATPALPAPTLTNNTLCAVASATDLLGNESTLPSSTTACLQILTTDPSAFSTLTSHVLFGVDIDAPTIAFSGGLAANARINTPTVATEFQVTVADVGAVGNSGMLSGAAVVGTVQIRSAALTPPSAGSCLVGTFSSGACNPASINVAPPFPLVPTTTVAASILTGYFTGSFVAQDAAGNSSAPVTRVVAHDDAVNVPALTTALFNTPLGGGTAVFNANSSDNFDLWTAVYTMTYGGGVLLATPLVFPTVTLNTFNTPPLVNSNVSAGITVTGFMRQVQDVTGNAPLAATAGFKPTNLAGIVTDQANNPSATANTAIPGASVTNGVSYLAALAPQLINSWAIVNAATSISNGAGPAAAVNPTSVTLNADVFGPTATFNPPFAVVNFFIVSGGNLVQIGSAAGSSSTVDDGSPNGRRHRYTFTWTPGAAQPVGVVTIHAIGVSAAGDGLTTLANTNITITNP